MLNSVKTQSYPIKIIASIQKQESKKALLEVDFVIMKIVKEMQVEK
jgi:hypothetical protein